MNTFDQIDEWDLQTTNLSRTRKRHYEVVVLGTGAIEPHNVHLPYGQDFLHTDYVARESCRKAWAKCQTVVRLPTIPFGVDCNLLGFPMTVSIRQATLDKLIGEIFTSMRHHGLRKFVIINGHGGNSFVPFVRQFQCDLDVHIFTADWWTVGHDRYKEFFTIADDHAGQFETGVGLELYPKLVELEKAAPPKMKPFRFEALRKGWVRTSRDFSRMTDCCGAANPLGGTKEGGRGYMDLVTDRLGDFIAEIANAPIDENFPFSPLEGK